MEALHGIAQFIRHLIRFIQNVGEEEDADEEVGGDHYTLLAILGMEVAESDRRHRRRHVIEHDEHLTLIVLVQYALALALELKAEEIFLAALSQFLPNC